MVFNLGCARMTQLAVSTSEVLHSLLPQGTNRNHARAYLFAVFHLICDHSIPARHIVAYTHFLPRRSSINNIVASTHYSFGELQRADVHVICR